MTAARTELVVAGFDETPHVLPQVRVGGVDVAAILAVRLDPDVSALAIGADVPAKATLNAPQTRSKATRH